MVCQNEHMPNDGQQHKVDVLLIKCHKVSYVQILTKLYPDPGPMTSDEASFLLVAAMENPPFSSCKEIR